MKKIAVELSDTKCIAKLSKGDMIATAHFLFIGLRSFGLNLELPFWFAVSSCDTVSAFAGKGKETAWQTWSCFPEAIESLLR